jgi:hypothetical protein
MLLLAVVALTSIFAIGGAVVARDSVSCAATVFVDGEAATSRDALLDQIRSAYRQAPGGSIDDSAYAIVGDIARAARLETLDENRAVYEADVATGVGTLAMLKSPDGWLIDAIQFSVPADLCAAVGQSTRP